MYANFKAIDEHVLGGVPVMWQFTAGIVSVAFGVLCIVGAIILHRKEFLVYHTRALPICGGLCFFFAGGVFFAARLLPSWLLICAFGLAALGMILFLEFWIWKIDYSAESDAFFLRTLFRRCWISYDEVTGITERPHGGLLYTKSHGKISADTVVGWDEFICEVERIYQTTSGGSFALPDVQEKLFHGYLRNPREFLAVFFLVGIIFLGATALPYAIFYSSLHTESSDCGQVQVQHFSVAQEDGSIDISDNAASRTYCCRNLNKILGEEEITALTEQISAKHTLTLLVPLEELADTDSNRKYWNVWEIRSGDETLFSIELAVAAERAEVKTITLVFSIIFLCYLAFVIFFCIVVSNAPKHPILVRLLVKEEYLTEPRKGT